MYFVFKFPAAVALAYSFLSAASATAHNVTVGAGNSFDFHPTCLTNVKPGDTIHFLFPSTIPHSVTESMSFNQPCVKKPDGIDSGVLNSTSSPSEWSTTISNVTGPMFIYCKVGNHCAQGMVFVINPTQSQSYETFKANAVKSPTGDGGSTTSKSPSPSTSVNGGDPSTSKGSSSSPGGGASSTPKGSPTSLLGSSSPTPSNAGIKNSVPNWTVTLAVAVLLARLSL